MGFFTKCEDAFTKERLELSFQRSQTNFEDGWQYATRHPVEAALVVGSLMALSTCYPEMLLTFLCVTALALICFNLFSPPTISDAVTSVGNDFSSWIRSI